MWVMDERGRTRIGLGVGGVSLEALGIPWVSDVEFHALRIRK